MDTLGFGHGNLEERLPKGASPREIVELVADELHRVANGEKRIGSLRQTMRECRDVLRQAIRGTSA